MYSSSRHVAAIVSRSPCCRLPSGDTNLIISTHTSNMVIYQRGKVVWLAKGPTVPVAIAVAAVGDLEAAIVILDDEGLLSVCYLGTTPPTTVLGFSESREPDWEVVQDRRKELMRIIRDKAPATDIATPPTSAHDITMRTSVRSCSAVTLLAVLCLYLLISIPDKVDALWHAAWPTLTHEMLPNHLKVLSRLYMLANGRNCSNRGAWISSFQRSWNKPFFQLAAQLTCNHMQVPAVLTGNEEFGEVTSGPQSGPTCNVKLYIGNNGSCDVSDVEICVHAAWPVTLDEDSHSITCLRAGGSTPCIINLVFSYDSIQIPCSTEVRFPGICYSLEPFRCIWTQLCESTTIQTLHLKPSRAVAHRSSSDMHLVEVYMNSFHVPRGSCTARLNASSQI